MVIRDINSIILSPICCAFKPLTGRKRLKIGRPMPSQFQRCHVVHHWVKISHPNFKFVNPILDILWYTICS